MKRFFYLCTILCTLFALMPIGALAQERGLATDSMKAKQFVKTLGKDARVLLFLPSSSPKNVFYTVKNDIKYYNVETGKVNDVQFIDSVVQDGLYYHNGIIVRALLNENGARDYYKPIILAGDSNIVVVTQDIMLDIKSNTVVWETRHIFKFSTRNMRFTTLLVPEAIQALFNTDNEYMDSKIYVSYKNKTVSITYYPDDNRGDYTYYTEIIGKAYSAVYNFDGKLITGISKDYTARDLINRIHENKANFKKYYSTQPQRKTAPQRRKTTSKRPVRR